MGWGRDRVNGWAAPASRWRGGCVGTMLVRVERGRGGSGGCVETAPVRVEVHGAGGSVVAGSRWQWGLCRDGAGAGRGTRRWWKRRSGVELAVAAVSRWQQRGGVEVVVVAGSVGSRWRGRGTAGAGGGVEGAAKSL
ncbi:hypothetical protein EDB85DRAFT_2280806, partial [Lactarius pseudohatsudake]